MVKTSIVITNHIKAGNIEDAKQLILKLSKSDVTTTLDRVTILLKKKNRLKLTDVNALRTKKTLITKLWKI